MLAADHLVSELHRRGIHYIAGHGEADLFAPLSPAALQAGLAAQPDARLRAALIAVLLQRPDWAPLAPTVFTRLADPHRPTFQLYYSAAHYLQCIYYEALQRVLGPFPALPDHFSHALNLEPGQPSPEKALERLASRHQEITGLPINWLGIYHHAAQRVVTRLEKEREWART